MNAHTIVVREHTAEFEALSDLEPLLTRAAALASAAVSIVDHDLGREHPASELMTLLQVIGETLDAAETVRGRGYSGAYHRRHP